MALIREAPLKQPAGLAPEGAKGKGSFSPEGGRRKPAPDWGVSVAPLLAETGGFTITGVDARLRKVQHIISAASAGFELTGHDAATAVVTALEAAAGAFTLTGHDVAMLRALVLAAEAGQLAITGHDAALLRALLLVAESGTFTVTGNDATLTAPGGGEVVVPIATGNDDGWEFTEDGVVTLDQGDIPISSVRLHAFRFTNIGVSQGADIASAFLTLRATSNGTAFAGTIRGEDVDNAAALSTNNSDISDRTPTTASASWSGFGGWSSGDALDTADISSIIEEIVGRGGWSSGNALVITIIGTSGVIDIAHFEHATLDPPKLTIVPA